MQKFQEGETVMAIYNASRGGITPYQGKIWKVHVSGGTMVYDINYDDGDYEARVPEEVITKIETGVEEEGSASVVPPASTSEPVVDPEPVVEPSAGATQETVETLVSLSAPDVALEPVDEPKVDAAEEPANVPSNGAGIANEAADFVAPMQKFQEGETVMAIYNASRGGITPYQGKIWKVHVSGGTMVYDINYDDGDYE